VVAEGVETPEQEALMRSMRCDELQGYLFSKPLPAGEASELLHTHRRALPAPPSGKKTRESTPAPIANQV
jgi:sensor c-di-GMP phosphodiesterase-like protein